MTETPEHQMELQKQQCVFCQIAKGNVTSKEIYEDDKVMAILDINPANPGHVILFPKEHYPLLPMMPTHAVEYLFRAVKKISRAQIAALKCDGNNIFVASGTAAGQKSSHVVIHLIPRKEGDSLDCFNLTKNEIDSKDQEALRKAIFDKAVQYFGHPDKEFEPVHDDPSGLEAGPSQFNIPPPEIPDEGLREKPPEQPNRPPAEQPVEQPAEPAAPEQPTEQDDHSIFEIPPPEIHEEDTEFIPKKKKLDLDRIADLFK